MRQCTSHLSSLHQLTRLSRKAERYDGHGSIINYVWDVRRESVDSVRILAPFDDSFSVQLLFCDGYDVAAEEEAIHLHYFASLPLQGVFQGEFIYHIASTRTT